MKNKIFRQKNLDKIRSPEKLEDYIRVTDVGVWFLLISVIVLLAGVCVWGIYGRIDSTVPASVIVEKGEAICIIAEKDMADVRSGMTVTFSEHEAVIKAIGEKRETDYRCPLSTGAVLADGIYEGRVIIKSYRPLSFILN